MLLRIIIAPTLLRDLKEIDDALEHYSRSSELEYP